MTTPEKDKIQEILEILAGQNQTLTEQGTKISEVHSTVNEMKVGLEGSIYTEGIVKRLEKVEQWKAETHNKLISQEVEEAGKKKVKRDFWYAAVAIIAVIYDLVETFLGLHSKK